MAEWQSGKVAKWKSGRVEEWHSGGGTKAVKIRSTKYEIRNKFEFSKIINLKRNITYYGQGIYERIMIMDSHTKQEVEGNGKGAGSWELGARSFCVAARRISYRYFTQRR